MLPGLVNSDYILSAMIDAAGIAALLATELKVTR